MYPSAVFWYWKRRQREIGHAHPSERQAVWHWIFVVSAVIALYFHVFVGVVQAYEKILTLKAIVPNI